MHYNSRFKNRRIQDKIKADRKFRKFTIISLSTIFSILLSGVILFNHWCDIRYWYRLRKSYGKELGPEWVCMDGDKLRKHKTMAYDINSHLFHVCSEGCYEYLSTHFQTAAYKTDTISGKKILKSDALIGLKSKKSPDVIYFEDRQTFNKYYVLNNLTKE